MEKKVLSAPNISCGHCVMAIQRAVGGLEGVESVSADAGTKKVTVSFDPIKVTMARIEETMAAEGYPVAQ